MSKADDALAQSVKARLVNRAHADGVEPNQLLSRFALERFLYRLSQSPYADRFVLKGAMLLLVWLGDSIRPTRDADLLGFGSLTVETLAEVFREVCIQKVEPDGMSFERSSVQVSQIREGNPYGGHRVKVVGRLGQARLRVQIDVGIGDVVAPDPEWLDYPTLLQQPAPRIRAYRAETAISEKLHAMVTLGTRNSRMRDFFDIHMLAGAMAFQGTDLVRAVRTTFAGRSTALPTSVPPALTAAFAHSSEKRTQWSAFLRKSGLKRAPSNFGDVVADVARFLLPLLEAARADAAIMGNWPAGGPWTDED